MTDDREEEIAANLARADDSLAAARTLAESSFFDFAASRAYYAAFYASAAALLALGIPFGKHAGVLHGVHQHLVRPGRIDPELGRSLNWLAELRATGDYGVTRRVPETEARRAIETADRLVAALRSLVGRALTGDRSRP